MNFYVRKLGHQELSYTEGKGGKQRGRYILFSKKFREFFPPFDLDLNDRSRLIGVIDDTSRKVTFCYFNWHKGKKFNQSKHLGSDLRFYLNKDSFPSHDHFRPGDYAVFFRYQIKSHEEIENYYKIFRFSPLHSEYNELEKLTTNDHRVIKNRRTYHGIFEELNFINTSDIELENFVFSKKAKDKYKNPETNCNTKNEFKEYVRIAYNFKCCVLGDQIDLTIDNKTSEKSYMNVQAAHLWPDSWLGPLRPSNGILLSLDLHWAFDTGQFTIDRENKILVHESLKDKPIGKYHGKKIFIPEDELYQPDQKYLEVHRNFVFGRLKPLGLEKPKGLSQYLRDNFNIALDK